MSLLDIKDYRLDIDTFDGPVHVLKGINLSINRGDTLGIVGESGSGKTVLVRSVLGIGPRNARVIEGGISFDGQNITSLSEKEWAKIRGIRISMIFQDPMTYLNPLFSIGRQISDVIAAHEKAAGHGVSPKAARRTRTEELLDQVGLPNPAMLFSQYPHQLSGGMRQRVMIAMALSCRPGLLLADEPTTALDATIQGQILRLLAARCRERRMAVLLITHDLGVAAQMADTVGVMYAGRLVESAPAQDLFADARHPYTQGLLHAAPSARSRGLERLPTIPGTVPSLQNMPTGCPFHPRCTSALPCCTTEMPPTFVQGAHRTACWLVKPA